MRIIQWRSSVAVGVSLLSFLYKEHGELTYLRRPAEYNAMRLLAYVHDPLAQSLEYLALPQSR